VRHPIPRSKTLDLGQRAAGMRASSWRGYKGECAVTVAEMTGMRLRSRLDLTRVWPDFLVWLAVSVFTLGLGWLVVAGHFFRSVINSVEVTGDDGAAVGRLVCDYDVERSTGDLLRWLLICIATLGVGLLFYSFHAARAALDHTRVEW